MSTRNDVNEPFSAPLLLDIDFIASRKISCWLSANELEIYFTAGESGDSVMHSIRQNPFDPFPAPVLVQSLSKYGFVSGISIAGDELYLYNVNLSGTKRSILTFHRNLTSVEENISDKPVDFILNQNYPNPFNPSTIISYQLPVSGKVTLKMYDVLGNEVAVLVDEYKPTGSYEVEFNLVRHYRESRNLTSGIYFYQLKAGNNIQTKKMILLK
ncbi:MAG: T9SS type A sorting domain-containing protein [Ignavibacteriales bacterium]|nr:T9SS type A sorting domain-containing protein [Ignavibacteriales bacterium]